MVANIFATLVVAGSNPYLAVFLLFFPFNWTWIRSEEFFPFQLDVDPLRRIRPRGLGRGSGWTGRRDGREAEAIL